MYETMYMFFACEFFYMGQATPLRLFFYMHFLQLSTAWVSSPPRSFLHACFLQNKFTKWISLLRPLHYWWVFLHLSFLHNTCFFLPHFFYRTHSSGSLFSYIYALAVKFYNSVSIKIPHRTHHIGSIYIYSTCELPQGTCCWRNTKRDNSNNYFTVMKSLKS